MSGKRNGSISGTLTLVVVSFDMSSKGDQRELTMEDVTRLLIECLANSDRVLVEEESPQARDSLSSARALH